MAVCTIRPTELASVSALDVTNSKVKQLEENNEQVSELLNKNNIDHEKFNTEIINIIKDIDQLKSENDRLKSINKELVEVSSLLNEELKFVNAQFYNITLWQIIKNSFRALFKKKDK